MPLNPDAVGTTSEPATASWKSKDALLYAVGVGAGTDELAYTTENTNGVPQQVLPTFPVVVGTGGAGAMRNVGTFNPALLVHGSQSVTLHRALPADGSVTMVGKLAHMWDKGKAAVVVLETDATDADGQPMFSTSSALFIRGEGGWGGERGPSGPQNVPPDREPDHVVTYTTSKDQALVYRLSGDRNPLHSDPSFAALGGFDRPILHGLCTYGFTGRALLHALCDGDSAKFRHIEGRFASPVIPGEALTIRIWRTEPGEAVFTTSAGAAGPADGEGGEDQRVVLDQGLCRFDG